MNNFLTVDACLSYYYFVIQANNEGEEITHSVCFKINVLLNFVSNGKKYNSIMIDGPINESSFPIIIFK